MAKRATHIIDAVTRHQYMTFLVDRGTHVLCGRPLYYAINAPNGANKARELTIWMPERVKRPRSTPGRFVADPKPYRECRECFRLAAMTPEGRLLEFAAKEDAKRAALAKLKTKADGVKQAALVERMARIDAMRLDVSVCRDAFLADGSLIRATPTNGNRVSTHAVLDAAVELYKLEHRSGGDKLIVMTSGSRKCRYCDHEQELQEPPGINNNDCNECGSRLKAYGRASKRHIACRFCRAILGRNQDPFVDHSHAMFDGPRVWGSENGKPVVTPERIDVWRHTVLCAFDYLNPIAKTNQDDEPIVVPVLPTKSFVLEHE